MIGTFADWKQEHSLAKHISRLDPAHRHVVPGGILFATWLRVQLDRLGWSPVQTARHVGISVEAVRRYLRGFMHPTPATLARIETGVNATYERPT